MKGKTKEIIVGMLTIVIGLPVAFTLIVLAWVAMMNKTNGEIVSSGETRQYLLYVPKTYDRNRLTPLVISLHAATFWPALQMRIDQWNELADKHGFLVVYPCATGVRRIWRGVGRGLELDAKFISDLMDKLEVSYNIDPARVYVNGFSNGGGMALALACMLSRRVAAVGAVAAATPLSEDWCRGTTPVPLLAFHGTADRIVPFAGGRSKHVRASFPAVRDWVENWARRNRCEGGKAEARITGDVRRLAYSSCADNADVVLYTVALGGHSWPGGKPLPEWFVGRTNKDINASSVMWDFFVQHPRVVK